MNAQNIKPNNPEPLQQKKILAYWLPIAASWLLMGSEQPFINGTLARLPEATKNLAAFGIVFAISLIIESPVISLLSTSTALARNRQSYLQIRKFTFHLMILVFVVQGLICLDPIFNLVIHQLLGAPENLSELIRTGLIIMILWSPVIAWRRFTQGILIRMGETHYIGKGTVIRLIVSAGSAFMLAVSGKFNGVAVASTALVFGVAIEAAYAHWSAKPLLDKEFGEGKTDLDERLSYKELIQFHAPLAGSILMYMLIGPLISAALARSPDPELSLAAWPVVSSLLFLTRAVTVGYPEVVIALLHEKDSQPVLLRFGIYIGIGCVLVLGLILFTPLSTLYFEKLLGIESELAEIAIFGARFALLLPLFTSLVSYYRGILTGKKKTMPITIGMAVELFVLIDALMVSVIFKLNGVASAAIAITVALAADMLVLIINQRNGKKKQLSII